MAPLHTIKLFANLVVIGKPYIGIFNMENHTEALLNSWVSLDDESQASMAWLR
jgi:hypothetical protein